MEASEGRIARLTARISRLWEYCSAGVWNDHRDLLKVNVVKTLNLTVRTFLSTDLQTKACGMTYRTLLAIVPVLALLFAIGRGFGFQTIVQNQLFNLVPSQRQALEVAIRFVDSALAQASEGIFVGVGIVFLLWTVVSLLDSVEETFNEVWGVTVDRSIFRKLTDYLAICIILPILMICAGGLQVMMSSTIQRIMPEAFSPLVEFSLDCLSVVLTWLFFMGAYMLIPNVKVKWQNALMAGILAGTAFQALQWLFLTGQLYVAKYNAIYGSFSFLPLMLIWMQLSWLITLAGALVCRASQDIALFSFERQSADISPRYRFEVEAALLTVVTDRFARGLPPVTPAELSHTYKIPPRLLAT
ncbi:MAG: YihY/virulence factor BrkB family protein, partial [Duncaniella sp.]|nr:YihY/virulence factor BrkB family protein [Duncaniella sp.]